HVYSIGGGARTITVDLIDEDGVHAAAASLTFNVQNLGPSIALSGANSVARGTEYTLTLGEVSNTAGKSIADYIVNWGDGNTDVYSADGEVTHIYAIGSGPRFITVDLIDE